MTLEQQLEEETAAALPPDIPHATILVSGYLKTVLKHRWVIVPVSSQSLTLGEPPGAPSAGVTGQCIALCGCTPPMDAVVKVSLLTH